MGVRSEVIPFLSAALVFGLMVLVVCRLFKVGNKRAALAGFVPALILMGYFLYFFRDPGRTAPADANAVVSGADGRIAAITEIEPDAFDGLATRAGLDMSDLPAFAGVKMIRISIFLSLFNVHVNRAPISGQSQFLGYFPGKHFFTFHEKSSDHNQHNSILISNERTACLINQIVGPLCRRVVYWPDHNNTVDLRMGDRIGMMKFGSRLDLYFPAKDVTVLCAVDDRVKAGETIIARLNDKGGA